MTGTFGPPHDSFPNEGLTGHGRFISVGNKLLQMLLFSMVIVLVVGVVSFIGLRRVNWLSEHINSHNMPVIWSTQEAIVALAQSQSVAEKIFDFSSYDEAEQIRHVESVFFTSANQVDVYLKAIALGSESRDFQSDSGGLTYTTWQRLGLKGKLVVLPPSPQLVAQINKAQTDFSGYLHQVSLAFAKRKKYLRLSANNSEYDALLALKESRSAATQGRLYTATVIDALQSVLRTLTADVKTNYEELQKVQRVTELTILWATAMSGFGFLLMGVWYVKQIVLVPLADLYGTVNKIQSGDFTSRARVGSNDELGMLAESFNRMTADLLELRFSLEAKVSEKTKILEELLAKSSEQNAILKNTKSAMQNLLEDSRLAELREQEGKEELRRALDKIGQFASIADGERHTYLLLLSSIGEGVFVVDMNRNITIVNKAAVDIVGFTKEELVGRRFTDILRYIQKDNTPLDGVFWDSAFKSKTPVILPPGISVIGKSGKPVPIADVISPIIDTHSNEHKGLIITFRDVREERALEDARINFISIASHQLRTPLTSMRWFSEMLMAGDAGILMEDQKHFVERIYQGTDRMINLVNMLLQIARVEAGRLKIEPIAVDLKNTVSGVLLILKANIESKSLTIDVRTTPDPFPKILLDQDVIWHVFQNLISNAVRYSRDKATIWVNIEKKEDGALCSVRDTGIGIPESQKNRVFEKFFRAENAVKSVPEGSGLGTSLVKLLVEGWGGKIWFESAENIGTTFFFTIPFVGMKAKEGDVKLAV